MYVFSARPFENHLCERLPCLKIINNNNNTGVGLFTDDTKLYKAVQNPSDALVLQEDIRSLQSWSEENRLRFNNSKCKVLSITRKSSTLITSYSLDGQQLALTNTEIDLGVVANFFSVDSLTPQSSLIVRHIIHLRPGFRALSMHPCVPCVTHRCTMVER
jgi:hypothetical protein